MNDTDMDQSKTLEQRLATFNAENSHSGGRKLKFHEQCSAFAALYGGTKPFIVARAFGVSPTTVSHIAGCLEQDPDPTRRRLVINGSIIEEKVHIRDHNQGRSMNRAMHYESVAREFEALGVQEFNRRYFTEETMDRLDLARSQLRAERRNPPAKPYREPVQKKPEDMSTSELLAYYAEHPELDPRKDYSPT